jgi:hypothetical protein
MAGFVYFHFILFFFWGRRGALFSENRSCTTLLPWKANAYQVAVPDLSPVSWVGRTTGIFRSTEPLDFYPSPILRFLDDPLVIGAVCFGWVKFLLIHVQTFLIQVVPIHYQVRGLGWYGIATCNTT